MNDSSPVAAVRARLGEHFADHRRDEAQITFLGAPPMTVVRYAPTPGGEGDDIVWYCTIGCSETPMDPEAMVPDPSAPRAEVIIGVRRGVDAVLRSLAVVGASPVVDGLVLREGLLVDLESPLWPGAAFTGVVLERSGIPPVSGPWGAVVDIIRAVPVTQIEAAWVRIKGANALRQAWDEAGIDTFDPDRPAVNPR